MGIFDAFINAVTYDDRKKQAEKAADLDEANYQAMLDQQKWDRNMQYTMFRREDNSVQRRVNDLKKAGLSPVLAAGQGARAGNVVPIKPPQKSSRGLEMKSAALQSLSQNNVTTAEITKTKAEIDLIKAQADQTKANTELISAKTDSTTNLTSQQIQKFKYELSLLKTKENFEFFSLESNRNIKEQERLKATAEASKAWSESQLKSIELGYQDVLRQYIEKKNPWMTPAVVEYQMAKTVQSLKEKEDKLYYIMQGNAVLSNASKFFR